MDVVVVDIGAFRATGDDEEVRGTVNDGGAAVRGVLPLQPATDTTTTQTTAREARTTSVCRLPPGFQSKTLTVHKN